VNPWDKDGSQWWQLCSLLPKQVNERGSEVKLEWELKPMVTRVLGAPDPPHGSVVLLAIRHYHGFDCGRARYCHRLLFL